MNRCEICACNISDDKQRCSYCTAKPPLAAPPGSALRCKMAWADHIGCRYDDERVVYADTCGWPDSFRDFKAGWDAAIKFRSQNTELRHGGDE